MRCRFAPSTTGPAHPGTLLAALLAWLDARSKGAEFLLRFEDIDTDRCRPEWHDAMQEALRWLGLDWDREFTQSGARAQHTTALDTLAEQGRLYPCRCTRKDLHGAPYANTCRSRTLPVGGWRATRDVLRVNLEGLDTTFVEETGDVATAWDGADVLVRRRDGAIAYNMAVGVDDGHSRIDRVVRGRDLLSCTPAQAALTRALGLRVPVYRHHLLLLEPRGEKLAKLHGSVSFATLRKRYSSEERLGKLACAAGLPVTDAPGNLGVVLGDFDWARVRVRDRVVRWQNDELVLGD